MCVIECSRDSECPGDNKCCTLLSCGSICTTPLTATSPKTSEIQNSQANDSVNDCNNECDNSRQCGAMALCMKKGCKRICQSFKSSSSKPKLKPIPTASATPNNVIQLPFARHQRNCTDQCLRNVHCDPGYVCVPKGCRNICEKPIGQSHIGHSSMPKVVDCNDRCTSDIHCPFRHNCIQDGCRKICHKPDSTFSVLGTRNVESNPLSNSGSCEIQCMFDSDCPIGLMCFEEGCNTTCISKEIITTLINQINKIAPTVASSFSKTNERNTEECRDECKIDRDCLTGFYCRAQGCKRICKAAFGDALPPSPLPKIAATTQHLFCNNECFSDRECPIGSFCRQDGCRLKCKNDLNSCTDQCLSNSDCGVGFVCKQKGCKQECVEGFITTTPAPRNCQNECNSNRDCAFGYVCALDGCKNICTQYKPVQSQRIEQDMLSNNCNIECSRDTDCSSSHICIKDGCNRVCVRSRTNSPSGAATCTDQCSGDNDCSIGSYCRLRGCRLECVVSERFSSVSQPDGFSQIPSRSSNPFETHGRPCFTECFSNNQCPLGSTCIQDGCRRTCENQSLGRFNP